jgi:C4-dicarboxylate-specific signal transduction histidine kinase
LTFGGRHAVLVVAQDITERKRAEQALQAKDEELRVMSAQLWQAAKLATMGKLAASIAHELNNPLATVTLRIESLLAQAAADTPQWRALTVVEQEVERMGQLVANLLQFSRRGQPQISLLDVREDIDNTLTLMHYHLRNHRDYSSGSSPLMVLLHVDRQQLRRVFLNLLTNASDAYATGRYASYWALR